MSLRLRLLIALAPLFVIGLIVADVATYASLHSYLVKQLDDQILAMHDQVYAAELNPDSGGPGTRGGIQSGLPVGTYGAITTASGAPVVAPIEVVLRGQSATSHPVLPATLTPGSDSSPVFYDVAGTGSVSQYRVYVEVAPTTTNDLLIVGLPLDGVNATLHQLLFLEIGVSGGVTVIVLLATWIIVRRGLRPLERMASTARSIVATDLGKRVEPSTENTEVGRLGLALNTMLAQLQEAFAERQRNEQRLRHFISDASHELRTPLTSVQGYAELLQRAPDMNRDDLLLAMRRMEEETQRMGVLVDDLLLLARLDQGRPLQRESVDLEALVMDSCADAQVADPGRSISARAAAPLVVTGDDLRLRQVLSNLLRNAIVHTPPATPIEVTLRPDDGHAVIDVIDHGRGVPTGHTERIFERFHRADPERSGDRGGSGLGLSIVAAVVAAHNGRVRVLETPGGGATFRVELPLRDGVDQQPAILASLAPTPPP